MESSGGFQGSPEGGRCRLREALSSPSRGLELNSQHPGRMLEAVAGAYNQCAGEEETSGFLARIGQFNLSGKTPDQWEALSKKKKKTKVDVT